VPMSSPTSRSLERLRKEGWTAGVVEKWIPMTKQRLDLFGCIDIVAVRPGQTLGVQATSDSNVNGRITKSIQLPGLLAWLQASNRFQVWGWGKKGKKGQRKLWSLRIQEIVLLGGCPYVIAEK
jgi:hypothetical protein